MRLRNFALSIALSRAAQSRKILATADSLWYESAGMTKSVLYIIGVIFVIVILLKVLGLF
jgi:hypothetical protein